VPEYGSARRMELPELTIRFVTGAEEGAFEARWLVKDEPQAKLTLPIEDRWIVEQVDLWSPELPADLDEELERKERAGERRSSSPATVALVVLLVVLIAWLLNRLL